MSAALSTIAVRVCEPFENAGYVERVQAPSVELENTLPNNNPPSRTTILTPLTAVPEITGNVPVTSPFTGDVITGAATLFLEPSFTTVGVGVGVDVQELAKLNTDKELSSNAVA